MCVTSEEAPDRYGKLSVTKEELYVNYREYFKEMISDEAVRVVAIDTAGLEVRRVWVAAVDRRPI